MAGLFSNDWFTKGTGADAWVAQKRKDRETEETRQASLAAIKGQDQPQSSQPQPDNKNPLQHVGDFLYNAGKSIVDTTVDTVQGAQKTIAGVGKTNELAANTDKLNELNKQRSDYMGKLAESDFNKPDVKKKLADYQSQADQIMGKGKQITQSQEVKDFQNLDAKKLAFEAGETALNVGTLGAGAPLKALAEQGINTAAKAGLDFAGKDVAENIIKDQAAKRGANFVASKVAAGGSENAAKIAANLPGVVAKQTAESGVKTLAKNAGKDAILGAGFGTLATGADNPNASGEDLTTGAVTGALFGGLTPVAGAGIKKGFTKLVGAIKGNAGKTAEQAAASQTAKDLSEGKVAFQDNVPRTPDGNVDINKMLNESATAAANKHEEGFLQKVAGTIGQHTNPLGLAREIDQKAADRLGIAYKDLPASDSLEHNIQMKANVDNIVNTLAREKTGTGASFQDLAKKYTTDTPEAKEFANYTAAKYDLDRRANGRQEVIGSAKTNDLQQFVDDYEKRNPNAVTDLQTKNNFYQHAADELHAGGLLSDKEYADITNSSDVATPFNRIFADKEALTEQQIPGRRTGSIAKQTVIKGIKGGTEPIDASLDVVLQRVHKAVTQRIDNNIANRLRVAAETGDINGGRVFQEAGAKELKGAARTERIETNKSIRILEKKMGLSQRQANKLGTEINNLNKSGLNEALKVGGQPSMQNVSTENLSKLGKVTGRSNNARSVIKSLIEADSSKLTAIQKKIAVREPKLADKLNKVIEHKQAIDAKKIAVEDLKDIEVGLTREGTTGKAFINGIQNGQTFRVELPPKIINRLDKLGKTEVNTALKIVGGINQAFRIAWVGALAPGFAVKSALWDTVMGVVNSKEGFRTLAPSAVKASFKAMTEKDEFLQKLRKAGASTVGSSQLGIHAKITSESLGATKNLWSRVKFGAKNPQATLDSLDVFGGKLASLTRTRVARASYDRAIKQGMNEEQALATAAYSYNNVMPDFATMSPLIRQINTVIPFTNASIAGTRSLAQGFKRAPLATSAKVLGLGVTPAIAVAAYSMSSDAGRKYYQDMVDAGNTDTLNNNLIVVLPGATKNDKTGEWTGVIKIPMVPEFRNINSQAWRSVEGLKGGKNNDPTQVASDLFDFVTGSVRTLSNPLVDIKTVLDGKDPRTGKQLVGDNLKDLPLDQQKYDTTSGAGEMVGKLFGTSPIQGDKIIGQFGTAGKAAKSGSAVDALSGNISDTYTGSYGQKVSNAFYDTYNPVKSARDKASKEVTSLVTQGRINEAKRRADEFNSSLSGKFKGFADKYDNSSEYNKAWDDMLTGLYISTSEDSFKARVKQK